MIINPYRFGTVPTPVIDVMGVSASHAYSLRKLRAAYAGSSVRVRRSSDNAETDIGFTVMGDLDTAALLTHVGAGDGFVTTFYDQSGNARNLTQTTAANQPQIASSGAMITIVGSMPGMLFDGSNDLLLGSAVTIAQPFSRSSVVKFHAVTSGKNLYSDGVQNSCYFSASGSLAIYAGVTGVFKTGISAGDASAVLEIVNTSLSEGWWHGVPYACSPTSPGSNSSLRTNLGGEYNGTTQLNWVNATFSEYIVFPSSISGTNRNVLINSQNAYWGTT